MKRKLVLTITAIMLAAALAVGGSLAYFTDTQEAENVFTIGNVTIDLEEPKWDCTGKKDAEDVYPGEALAKDPIVSNTGANPCFVRIQVTGLDQFGDEGEIQYRTNYVVGALGQNWVKEGDYFYFSKPLPTGMSTSALFDSIVMPTGLTEHPELGECSVNVIAQAVQAQGARPSYAEVEQMTVPEIADWFTTCGF